LPTLAVLVFFPSLIFHYQKIDKYKRKYRENISVGKFSRDFTDGNIPLVYTEGITMGKKIKTKQKKNDDVSFLPTDLPTENSVGIFQRVNHRRIEKSSVLFGGFLKKFN